jgi:hypothetical protein
MIYSQTVEGKKFSEMIYFSANCFIIFIKSVSFTTSKHNIFIQRKIYRCA